MRGLRAFLREGFVVEFARGDGVEAWIICNGSSLSLAVPVCKRHQDTIQYIIQLTARVLRETAQHEVSVLLQQHVLSPVTAVRIRIREMLRAVQFDDHTGVGTEKVRLHHAPIVEGDGQFCI